MVFQWNKNPLPYNFHVYQAGYGSKNIGRSISSGDQGFIAIHIDDLPSGRIIDLGDGLSMVYNMV